MHNKSFTVDNQVSVVGGRNIANEYFGAGGGIGFADLDVLVVGPVVHEVSKEFDLYWNSASAYPAAGFVGAPRPESSASLAGQICDDTCGPGSLRLPRGRPPGAARQRAARPASCSSIGRPRRSLYDDPAKTLDATARTDVLLFPELIRTMGRPEKMFDIVSPYFVPGDDGTAMLD